MGLALFLTVAIMWPVGNDIYTRGVGPYMEGEIEAKEAVYHIHPLRTFMLRQTREADLMLFYEINNAKRPNTPADVEMQLLIPAFVISELRTAFRNGIFGVHSILASRHLVVASLTMSLGLVMLPPALLSMPLKLMLFVLADGWNLMVGSLVRSFG